MLHSRSFAAALLITLAAGLAGCGGGGAEVQTESLTTTTTLGQELKDLDDARQKGIITQEQYEKAKAGLIKQRTK